MNEERNIPVGRLAAIAACLVMLAAPLSCKLAGDAPGSDETTGELSLRITTLPSLIASKSSSGRAIAFADRVTLKLLNEAGDATAYEKTFGIADESSISLSWNVPAGTYYRLLAEVYNDEVSTTVPVVSGGSDMSAPVVVTAGATSSVSVVCSPYDRSGDIYPAAASTGENIVDFSLGTRGEAWYGIHGNSGLTKVTIVPSVPVSGSSRGSSPAFDYLAGVYDEGSVYVGGAAFTSSGALLFDSVAGYFYFLVVAANSAADFTVSAEDVVALSSASTTGLTKGKVAWYAVTVPSGSTGPLTVELSGTYDPAAPLMITLYDTDSSTTLGVGATATMTSSTPVTATSTTVVTAGKTYFIKVSGGDGTDSYNLNWTVAWMGSLSVGIS